MVGSYWDLPLLILPLRLNQVKTSQGKTTTLWGFLDLKSELIRKGETQNQGKNGQI